MQLGLRKARAQLRPFRLGFLHSVLAEAHLSCLQDGQNVLQPVPFGYRDEVGCAGGRDGRISGCGNPGQNGLEILGGIGGYGRRCGGHLMPSAVERAKLARAALALNASSALPPLILMTDERRLQDPVAAARTLPKGAAIILRHTQPEARASLAEALRRIAQERGLLLLIAGDASLPARIGANGLHLPETRACEARHWRAAHPSWLITIAAHSERALAVAARSGADAALLAPAFPTFSHIERVSLGVTRFRLMAARAVLPVYALGGITAQTVQRLAGAKLVGIAAIDGLLPDQSS